MSEYTIEHHLGMNIFVHQFSTNTRNKSFLGTYLKYTYFSK